MGVPISSLRESLTLIPVVIAGGGLAGASAACGLARAGLSVTLLERENAAAHKVCGEFLSGPAVAELARLGIDVAELGAPTIKAMRLVYRGRVAEARLPFQAVGLSRKLLDETLLVQAAQLGADVRRGVRIRRAEHGSVITDGDTFHAPVLMLATGKHDLRGLERSVRSPPDELIGFKMHLRLRPEQKAELAGYVELILFRRGYAGLQMIEDGTANLCLLVDRSYYEQTGKSWHSLLSSLIGEDDRFARRLDGAVECWPKPLSVFRIPYGFVHHGAEKAGVYRVGDQAAVIPSFCGDGMSIALHTARLAVQCVVAGHGSAAYHMAMRQHTSPPIGLASTLYRASRIPGGRQVAVNAVRIWPGLVSHLTRRTRVGSV